MTVGLVVPVLLLVAGAVLLTAGAEGFAEHVTPAASRLGVTVLALGVLLAGAEPEEAVTAMLASGQAHPALAAGDAIGANLVILTLTLGLAALVARLPVDRRILEYGVASAVAGAVTVLFLWNGLVTRLEGAVLVLLYAAGVAWVWRREKQPPVIGEMAELAEEDEPGRAEGSGREDSGRGEDSGRREDPGRAEDPGRGEDSGRPLLFVLLGLVGMVLGGYLAVRGAEGLVDVLHLGESVVGLTLLALATSAEMVALVWAAARRGVTELVVAGAVGSVGYNATVSVGLAALIRPLGLGRHNLVLDVAVLTAVLPLVLLLGRRTGTLPRAVGVLLVLGYPAATAWLFAS